MLMLNANFTPNLNHFNLTSVVNIKKLTNFANHMHRLACSHTYEQNDLSGKKIHHSVDMSLTLLGHANVPLRFLAICL